MLDFVHLYLSEGIFSLMVAETNRFAQQFFANLGNEGTSNYSRKWEPVDINEMKRFIGVILLMGIIYKPTIPLYWVKDEIFWTPSFSEIMPRTRFQLILKFLHFNNNLDIPSTERIPSVLITPYFGKGHILFTDNFYTSPTLASYFLSRQTHLCGTVRRNRKHFPCDIENVDLDKGTSTFMKHTNGRPMFVLLVTSRRSRESR